MTTTTYLVTAYDIPRSGAPTITAQIKTADPHEALAAFNVRTSYDRLRMLDLEQLEARGGLYTGGSTSVERPRMVTLERAR